MRNSPISHNDDLISTLAKRLCRFRLETAAVIILVFFLVLLDSTLTLVVNSYLGTGLVDIIIGRVSSWRSGRSRRLRISRPNDNPAVIPTCYCPVDIVNNACFIVVTICENLFRTFNSKSSNCSVSVKYRFGSIRIVFNWEVLEVLLTVE